MSSVAYLHFNSLEALPSPADVRDRTACFLACKSEPGCGYRGVYNVTVSKGLPLQVTYRMRPFAVLREPALLIGSVALVFFLIIGWLRLDLTITRDARWAAGQKHAQAAATAQKLVAVLAGAHMLSDRHMVAPVRQML